MGFILYDRPLRVLAVTGGHPFDRNAFAAMFESMDDIFVSFVDHPAAQAILNPQAAADYDAILFFDVPGIDLWAGLTRQDPALVEPSAELREGVEALLASGKGVIALHHAIAAWPVWDDYATWLGGRFQYVSGHLRGRPVPDSGYLQNVEYDVRIVADHPVTAGLPGQFPLTDELYLYQVFEQEVLPLAIADRAFEARDFFSAEAAVADGRMHSNDGWSHPSGSNLIAWAKPALNSPLVYIQPGDGASTYENPHYRRLLSNALHWVASPDAHRWAAAGATV